MAFHAARIRNTGAALMTAWESARLQWHDGISAEYERVYMSELEQLLRELARECEDFEECLRRAEAVVDRA